ncbi:MAG TPA: ADOP family duplicated permease, partial [Longimicrobiales bacterium]|nr:ADOP family duplicated permease [Longimicrobiales bacterium]
RIDIRLAMRSFLRRPGVPAVIILTLALAIGAGTAVFSLFDAVVLNPLPVPEQEELILLHEERAGARNTPGFSYPMSRFLREHSTTTEGIAGWITTGAGVSAGVSAGGFTEQLTAGLVTGNYFTVLGLRPQQGRLFVADDEAAPGATPHVVLSDALWRRAFGADPDVIGRTIAVNETPFTVIGVAPPRFRGTSLAEPVDVWVPITMLRTVARGGLLANPQALDTWFFSLFRHLARVPEGTPVDRVLAELSTLHATGLASAPEYDPAAAGTEPPVIVTATPLAEAAVARSRDELLRFLAVLAAVVGIVLAVACVNVANLLLMRSRERQREMSIRAAVGASGARVIRQLLAESVVLAAAAGAGGVLIALAALRLVASFSLPGGIALTDVALPLDMRVLGFSAAVSLACAVAFGIAPAIAASRADVMNALRGGQAANPGRIRAGNAMIAVQVALSLVLLVAGGLLGRSLQEGLSVDTGFRSDGVATVAVGLRQHGYSPEEAVPFIRSVLEATASRAGVQHAAAATRVPIETDAFRMPILVADGGAAPEPSGRRDVGDAPHLPLVGMTPGYLETLGLDLIAGRGIEWSDRDGTEPVAVVTENAAELLWRDQNPIGRQFVAMFGDPVTVVGVVRDAHITSLTEREPHIFMPLIQTFNFAGMDRLRFVAAGSSAAGSMTALRDVIRAADPQLPMFDERNVKQHIDAVLMPQRFGSLLLAVLAAIALLTCAIGIYAVAAFDVATRRRELGIRAALGAGPRELVHAVIVRAGVAICIGVGAGLALAAITTRGLRGLLFGITPYDSAAYLGAAVVLGLVAVTAGWLPARRAARTDPLHVMRED